jgi:hypothetical protein
MKTAMSKTLLIEIQQASLVLFNVACLYTPAFTGFFSEIVPKIKKLKKIKDSKPSSETRILHYKL